MTQETAERFRMCQPRWVDVNGELHRGHLRKPLKACLDRLKNEEISYTSWHTVWLMF
jgi:hypothetical protein